MKQIAIIGAGLSGLTLATQLADIAHITVFEKHGHVSGRMATREHDGDAYDHGAQFFTVKHPAFQRLIEQMVRQGVVARWEAKFAEIDDVYVKAYRDWDASFPHYVGVPSMASVGRWMELQLKQRGVQILCNTQVGALLKIQDAWALMDTDGQELGRFDWVITAIPAQQATQLLPHNIDYLQTLNDVEMLPCYALMLGFDKPIARSWDVAHVANHPTLSWISVNSSKPQRRDRSSLVVMSRNLWAKEHFADAEAWVMDAMMQDLSAILGEQVFSANQRILKKWHFANAPKMPIEQVLMDRQLQLASCGDWCISGRVESAFVSSLQLADALRNHLDSEQT